MFRKEDINPLGFSFKSQGLQSSYWSTMHVIYLFTCKLLTFTVLAQAELLAFQGLGKHLTVANFVSVAPN